MKQFLLFGGFPLLTLVLSVSMPAPAHQSSVNLSDDQAKAVVKSALAALGGERFLNMHSRVASGRIYSFFRDQTSGSDVARIYTEYLPSIPKDGLAVRERQLLGKKLDYSYLYLEKQAWDITFRGARPVERELWDRYARSTANDILYFLKYRMQEPNLYFDFIGSQVFLSRHVEVVDIIDSENQAIRVYFDHNTHLPIRETFSWLDPDTRYRNDEVIDYDKYRDIGGGVMWPFNTERARNGYKSFQMFANSMEANGAIPPKTLELPPGTRILDR